MQLTREQTSNFLRALKDVPIGDMNKSLYVPLDAVRGADGATSTDLLWKTLVNMDEACLLFSGFPGSGKTTELQQLRARLTRELEPATKQIDNDPLPTEVVFVDGEHLFDLFQPVGIADVLRGIAFRLDEEATAIEKRNNVTSPKNGFVSRFIEFLKKTKIEFIGKIDFSQYLAGVNLMLEIKNSPSFREAAREAIAQRGQAFLDLARESIGESIARMKHASQNKYLRVVVIVDGLEKIQPMQESDRDAIERSVELLYVTQAPQLRVPSCHVVYTFPLWLKYRYAVWNAYDAPPLILPMVKVLDQYTNAEVEEGIRALVNVVGHRIDIPAVFGQASSNVLRRLVLASGGYLRDLLRIVRDIILLGQDFPVSAEFVDRTLARMQQDYAHTLLGSDLGVLADVAVTRAPPHDTEGRMAAFARLYERRLILAYRNGNEWYDVHPIIRKDKRVEQAIAKARGTEF